MLFTKTEKSREDSDDEDEDSAFSYTQVALVMRGGI